MLSQWWASVVSGRPASDQEGLAPKDLASPPPGIRARATNLLATFPKATEDKREYYGMGAFPMDLSGKEPLAVYEHRAFADCAAVKDLEELSSDTWGKIAEVFYKRFVAPFV